MNALRLEINIGTKKAPNWQTAYLKEDESIDIEVHSPLWNKSDTFSQEFNLPFEPNRHILGNVDDMFGRSIYGALYNKQFRLWLCGTLFMSGLIDLDKEVDLDGDGVSVSLISGRKVFDDMLDGVNAQDVEVFWGDLRKGHAKDGTELVTEAQKDTLDNSKIVAETYPGKTIKNVQIGWSYNNEGVPCTVGIGTRWSYQGHGTSRSGDTQRVFDVKLDIPQFMRVSIESDALMDMMNTSKEYDSSDRYRRPYCNIPLCAQKFEKDANGDWVSKRGYVTEHIEPYRINSSPCFFVLFWLEQLFDIFIDVKYDISKLLSYADLRRLCFVNLKCKFDVIKTKYINSKLDDRLMSFPFNDAHGVDVSRRIDLGRDMIGIGASSMTGPIRTNAEGKSYINGNAIHYHGNGDALKGWDKKDYDDYTEAPIVRVYCAGDSSEYKLQVKEGGCPLLEAYATSENFPDVEAKNILEALENAFGFKFLYDERSNTVTACFYDDIIASREISELDVIVSDVYKRENHTKGFVLKYSSSSAAKKNNLTGEEELVKGGEDTTYNYNDNRYVEPIQGEITPNGKTGIDYVRFISDQITSYDETYYVSGKTGNGFRIKVDADATDESKWYPSLFEVGGFRDVNYGDCSDDDYIETKEIGFNPVIPNDCNVDNEKKQASDDDASSDAPPSYYIFASDVEVHEPKNQGQVSFAKYIDIKWMKNALVEMGINIDNVTINSIQPGFVGEGKLQWNFNFNLPMGCDDSDKNANPFNKVDMGFTLGFMRPTNKDGSIRYYDYNYDGLGHSKWYKTAQVHGGMVTADSCDVYGNIYTAGDGKPGLSLKLKAEKPVKNEHTNTPDERPFRIADESNGEFDKTDVANRKIYNGKKYVVDYNFGNALYYEISDTCKNRGLFDKFWSNYAYFVTHRKVAVITIPGNSISITTLTNLDLKKKYRIGNYVGLINKYAYSVSKDGIGDVTLELYYL